jgi:hypothetical protein
VSADLSFLKEMEKLKILIIIEYFENIADPSYLLHLSNLEILYINGIHIKNPYSFNFINNKKLKYLALKAVTLDWAGRYYELVIENIPESLKYMDMSLSSFILLTKDFLDKLSSIPYVFLDDPQYRIYQLFPYRGSIKEVDKSYFEDKPNFIFKNPDEVLPEEYRKENIFALFGEKY